MRAIRVSSEFVPPWTGLGPGPFELSCAQSDFLDDLVIITRKTGNTSVFDSDQKFSVIRVKSSRDFVFALKSLLTVKKLMTKERYDIIHCHGFNGFFILLFRNLLPYRVKVVSSVHIVRKAQFEHSQNFTNSAGVRRKLARSRYLFQERFCFKKSDLLTAVSPTLKEEIDKFYPKSAKSVAIGNGVNTRRFDRLSFGKKGKMLTGVNFIFVGKLNGRKGELDLLSAIAKISDNIKFTLTIVGEGPNTNLVKQMIRLNDLENRVKVIGYMAHEELVPLLLDADVFILPSYSEGLPKVVLEAMYTRCLLMVSNIPAHKSFLTDNEAIFLKLGDVEHIRNKIENVIQELDSEHEKVKNAYDLVLTKYTWEIVAKNLNQEYKSLVNE